METVRYEDLTDEHKAGPVAMAPASTPLTISSGSFAMTGPSTSRPIRPSMRSGAGTAPIRLAGTWSKTSPTPHQTLVNIRPL